MGAAKRARPWRTLESLSGAEPWGWPLTRMVRAPRTPSENANVGRHFRVGKDGKYDFFVRAEFVNIFNRTLMPAPTTTNPQNLPIKGAGGGSIYTSGFGVISAYYPPNTAISPGTVLGAGVATLQGRTGTLIARFQF
jgi:hypothetical protein